jgi:NAD+ synthase
MNDLVVNPEILSNNIVSFLSTTFKREGFTDAVIAVSGGVDSATSLALTVKALGSQHVFPLFLPYGELNKQGLTDAQQVCKVCGIPSTQWVTIDISYFVDQIVAADISIDKVRKGNIMARMRMIVVYDVAKKMNALVVGTENKSEHYLGYYTRFGDEASDIEPLRELFKTQVYQLAKHLNVPESILQKPPSAGLWTGQTDEEEFGFSYQELDTVLDLYIDKKSSVEEITRMLKDEYIVDQVVKRVESNSFKHKLPYLPIVDKIQI